MPSKKNSIIIGLVALLSILLMSFVFKRCGMDTSTDAAKTTTSPHPDVPLVALQLREQEAKLALPFCEKKDCVSVNVQSIYTQDAWLNKWVNAKQGWVVQQQINLNQKLTLQGAVNAYVKKSDAWQGQVKTNRAYQLGISTRLAAQRNQFVLLQLGVDAKQEEVSINDRIYFFVADRKQQKQLNLLDVIEPNKRNAMHAIVQQGYQDWLKKQPKDVKLAAPKILYWGQADWFFDTEGIGVHYRGQDISEDAPQLDIYLSKAQTQAMLQPTIYQQMF